VLLSPRAPLRPWGLGRRRCGWREYDREKYVDLVLDAAETLLAPLGFTKDKLREGNGPKETTLNGYGAVDRGTPSL